MTTDDINNLYQTAQTAGEILSVADVIIMFASSILGILTTAVAFLVGVGRIGFRGIKIDGTFNTKKLFAITVYPFIYMLVGSIVYQLGSVLVHVIYAHTLTHPLNLFNFIPSNYNLTRITNSHFNVGNFLLNARNVIKDIALFFISFIYLSIYVFYASIAIDSLLSKATVTILYNVVLFFFIFIVGVIVASTYDSITSATLFSTPLVFHHQLATSISGFLKIEGIYYAKLAFSGRYFF